MQHRLAAVSALVLLALLAGCPNPPADSGKAPPIDTNLAARNETCETLPATDSAAIAATRDSTPARTKPKPEPEPPPKPRALPRMWDYGSDNCLPCIEMERILTPLMSEYQGKVDIRVINVYKEQEKTTQARIQVIPTQIFSDPEGKELFRHIGVYPRDSIIAKFKEFGWD
uniref:Thioredoxin n=1 Tax=candidate division WOR-3 bacterium TaxID=2052148 RepID=A0A7C4GFH5_UNCW3